MAAVFLEEPRAHHGDNRQGDHHGDGDGDRKNHREFAEQAPHHAAHHQDGNEDGNQRHAHRQNRETNLFRAFEGGLHRFHAMFEVARNVFDHHNRIVHHESRGNGQRHQRKIVQGVPDQIHRAERGDDGYRHRYARNKRRPGAAEEDEHHQNHQTNGDDHVALRVPQRIPGGDGAVAGDLETDRRRKLGLKLRHQSFNPRDRVDDIGIRLAVDLDLNHRIAVYHAEVPDIFIGIDDAAEVRQADGRAVPIDHHQILVVLRQEKLVGGVNRNLLLGVRERAFRFVRIGALEERADLIETHVVAGERLRIHFHANRGKRASTHRNLADAIDLRQLLRKHRGGDVVQLRPRHYIRLERHQQNRLVGRIDFPVSGEGGKIRREKPRRGVNGRLHFARRPIDVAAQIELECDRSRIQPSFWMSFP